MTIETIIAELNAVGEKYKKKYPVSTGFFCNRHHNQTTANLLSNLKLTDLKDQSLKGLLQYLLDTIYCQFKYPGELLGDLHDCVCRHYPEVAQAARELTAYKEEMATLGEDASLRKWEARTFKAAAQLGCEAIGKLVPVTDQRVAPVTVRHEASAAVVLPSKSLIDELKSLGANYLTQYPEGKRYFFESHHNHAQAKQLQNITTSDPQALLKYVTETIYPAFKNKRPGDLLQKLHDCLCRHFPAVKQAADKQTAWKSSLADLSSEAADRQWYFHDYAAAAREGLDNKVVAQVLAK